MTSFTCMTYNIHHGAGNDDCLTPSSPAGVVPHADCSLDLERIAQVILFESPDIVAVQELDRFWARSGGVDQPIELARLLDMSVVFGPNLQQGPNQDAEEPHEYGIAILCRHDILRSHHHMLHTEEGWEQRGFLDVRIAVPSVGEIAIINTHLQSGSRGKPNRGAILQRQRQAAEIAAYIKSIGVPVILMGDFNANLVDGEIEALAGKDSPVSDIWSELGESSPHTYPANPAKDAEIHIDHIFISREVGVSSAKVVTTELAALASDHFPVVAEIQMQTP